MDGQELVARVVGSSARLYEAVGRLADDDKQAWEVLTRTMSVIRHRFDTGAYEPASTFEALRRVAQAVDAILKPGTDNWNDDPRWSALIRNEIGKAACSAGLASHECVRGFFF
jgi:hypothetical protein